MFNKSLCLKVKDDVVDCKTENEEKCEEIIQEKILFHLNHLIFFNVFRSSLF